MHLIATECGLLDTGDELRLPNWTSSDVIATVAQFAARLHQCLAYVEEQGDVVDNEPSLTWTDAYLYSVIWLEIPDSWVSDGEDVEDALVRRAREGIESELADVSREEFEIELTQCLRKAARGIFDRRGTSATSRRSPMSLRRRTSHTDIRSPKAGRSRCVGEGHRAQALWPKRSGTSGRLDLDRSRNPRSQRCCRRCPNDCRDRPHPPCGVTTLPGEAGWLERGLHS